MDKRKLEKIKEIYANDFGRDPKEKEILSLLGKSQNVDRMPFYDLYLIYPPERILLESQNIIRKVGRNDFNTKEKYKKLRELLLASVLSLVFNKYNLGKWYIKSDESPDIKLHKFDKRAPKRKQGFFQNIEIIFIVNRITEQWAKNIEEEIVNFIKKIKFLKSYGHNASLLVSLSFNREKNIRFDYVTKLFLKSKVPFKQIWILIRLPNNKGYKIFEVYPNLNSMMFNFKTDKEYLF